MVLPAPAMVLKSRDGKFMFEKSSRMNFRERLFVSGLPRLEYYELGH